MLCNVCGFDHFTSAEYRSEAGRARALECRRCHAIVLDETVATSQEELALVRLAMAVRSEICGRPDEQSGLHDIRHWAR